MKLRWAVCIFAIITGHALGGEAAWKLATTPNYQILSQLDDRETAQWMRDFDQYILSISDLMKIDVRTLPPLTVVIFWPVTRTTHPTSCCASGWHDRQCIRPIHQATVLEHDRHGV